MSALARYFLLEGIEIYGYDLTKTALTKKLEAEGMTIHYEEKPKKIPRDIDLVILTPAIPDTNKEYKWLKKNGYEIKKRAEVLGEISKKKRTIAVAGTHGKTTTCSLITQILKYGKKDATAFLGGVLAKENTNFIHGKSKLVVLEADEYDRSFLHLKPEILIIMSMDADHLDVYGSVKEMHKAYEQLSLQVRKGGMLILGPGVIRYIHPEWMKNLRQREIKVYKQLKDFDFDSIRIKKSKYRFDYVDTVGSITKIKSNLPGLHNISNSASAIFVARTLGIGPQRIRKALKKFKGIKRRFEFVYEGDKVLVDDYAHHPEEVKYAVSTIKNLYPEKKVLGIFQPHLYSRTKDFYKGFAKELSGLDGVILLPIYPAREKPIKGIKSEMIYNLITKDEKYLVKEKSLIKKIKELKEYEVIMTIGAADLNKHHEGIIKVIKKKK